MSGVEWKPGDVAMVDGYVSVRSSSGAWYRSAPKDVLLVDSECPNARPLVVIDPHSNDVERLQDLYLAAEAKGLSGLSMQAALREFANPTPRCVAHGNEACPECSRIRTIDFSGGDCRHCTTYGTDGMHWDTCPGRIKGPVFATRDEALGAES